MQEEQTFTMDALQRECFTQIEENNPYYRLDKQISKMIETVTNTYRLEPKTNFFGHSAMGLPAMRFAMLYPEQIDTLIIGGNADEIPTPIGENAEKLKYPFGIQDFKELFGKEFNEQAFRQIAFRFYIGEYEHIDPNLDGIRDDNYGTRTDDKPGTGERFAPKKIAEEYKKIYNNMFQSNINLSIYERLKNVLEQYEKSGIDLKFLVYPKDCHSPIQAQDLRNAQFENGTNFEREGSKKAGKLLENIKELEEYSQKSTSDVADAYKQTSNKIMCHKEEGDRANRTQALIELAKEYEANKEKNLITPEIMKRLSNDRQVSKEREDAIEAISNLKPKENEAEKEEQK